MRRGQQDCVLWPPDRGGRIPGPPSHKARVQKRLQRSGQFVNETAALGITNRIAAWTSLTLQRGPRSVVLCTDGIADDLLPERLGDFADWLVHELCPLSPHERWRRLMSALRDWPTPRHLDDKTIVVAHVPASTR